MLFSTLFSKGDSCGSLDYQIMNQETKNQAEERFFCSAKRLQSLLSHCSLAIMVSWIIIIILDVAGLSFREDTETIGDYVAGYFPMLISLAFFTRNFVLAQPEQLSVKGTEPTISEIISGFVFATGIVYICSPIRLLIAVSEIQVFIVMPRLFSVANFSGFLSFETFGTVIIAPIIEEYIYRRLIQDRLIFWGEGIALFITSLFFSLGHFSAERILYTFAFSLVLGYVHAKTGKMRWNILLHMAMNLLAIVLDCWYGLYLFIVVAVLYVPIYLIRYKPWRNLNAGASEFPVGTKVKACLTSIPFLVCIILYFAVIVWHG